MTDRGIDPIGVSYHLPDWVNDAIDFDASYSSDDDKMALVIALANANVGHNTGGPFGAAVFDLTTDRLVAPGVNRVVPASNATAHAEIAAISIAGSRLGRHDLGDGGRHPMTLVSSVEPCAMCLGATPWSGVSRLVIGARDEDARAVGFDEGTKPRSWIESLHARDITVVRDVLRQEAADVLAAYRQAGGEIYNSARSASEEMG